MAWNYNKIGEIFNYREAEVQWNGYIMAIDWKVEETMSLSPNLANNNHKVEFSKKNIGFIRGSRAELLLQYSVLVGICFIAVFNCC